MKLILHVINEYRRSENLKSYTKLKNLPTIHKRSVKWDRIKRFQGFLKGTILKRKEVSKVFLVFS